MRNRLLGVALGLIVAALFLAGQFTRRPAGHWDLLPENEGAISAFALQYTRAAGPSLRPAYRAFLAQTDPHAEVIAVCGDAADAAEFRQCVAAWKIARPERVRTVVVGAPITGWCKDRFLVTATAPAHLLQPPPVPTGLATRTNDWLVAKSLQRDLPQRFQEVDIPLRFDSGDILATRSHLFVSDVLGRKNGYEKGLEGRLSRMFGRNVVWLHGTPDHHIGMFAAPLDDHTILVGDPDLARPVWTPGMDGRLGHADFSPTAAAPFQRAAAQLGAAGFRVVRVPLAVLGPQTYISYTNAVFETRGARRIVYMPWYDEPALDTMAAAVYRGEGWQIRPIPVRTLYRFRGTIGCVINVLART